MPFNIPKKPHYDDSPAIGSTYKVGPLPKKRGRKKSKKRYFTEDTDLAIKQYLASSNKAERFCDNLLKKGIILRNLSSFGLSECVRVTIGLPDENSFLINCIKELEM